MHDIVRGAASLKRTHLLLLLFAGIIATLLALRCLRLLSPDPAGTPATERRSEREVNVLLGVETDDEGRDVDDLAADARHACQWLYVTA